MGSEMCIRDRGSPTHLIIVWRQLPGTKEANIREDGHSPSAVSTAQDHERLTSHVNTVLKFLYPLGSVHVQQHTVSGSDERSLTAHIGM